MPLARKLAFRDRYVKFLTQSLDGADCDLSPMFLQSTPNTIILDLTESEWTKIFSALMTGADLTYPDEAHQVVWSFAKGVECSMDFCARMIDCLLNDADTRDALKQVLLELGFVPSGQDGTDGTAPEEITGEAVGEETCDESELYGQCLKVVEALNRATVDLLEIVEVLTNAIEYADAMISKIPVLGLLSLASTYIAKYQEAIQEYYLASYDLSVQEEIACELYCLVLPNCVITIEDIRQAYRNVISSYSPPSLDSELVDIFDWLLTIPDAISTLTAVSAHLIVLEIFARGGLFNSLTYRYINFFVQQSTPVEPFCGCDDDWCRIETFNGSGTGLFELTHGTDTATGIAPQNYTDGGNRINRSELNGDLTGGFTVTLVRMYFEATVNLNSVPEYTVMEATKTDGTTVAYSVAEVGQTRASGYYLEWTGLENDVRYLNFRVVAGSKTGTSPFGGSDAGDCRLQSIRMEGTGANPFGSDNC